MIQRPEYYERAPDGKQWPGTLEGLLLAMDDCAMASVLEPGAVFTLQAIRDGHAKPFQTYQDGIGMAA